MAAKPIRILLVDDNDDDITIFRDALEETSSIDLVGTAHNGEEALGYLRRDELHKNAQPPDLVLLDINMPKKNGFEVLAEIKSEPAFKHLPVIMLTTSQREEDIVRSYADGACSYITKPANFGALEEMIKELETYWTTVSRIPQSPELETN